MAQLKPGDPRHVGPYDVVARLTTDESAASIGRLYLARYPGVGLVAVRVIAPRLAADDAVRARLSDGVAAARAVASPSACPLRAAAILGERAPWIAWEHARGPSLAAVLAEHGRLPEPVVASLAVGLAEALRAIHDAGAVHGDLRPATVFLADGRPRVTGFGVTAAVQAAARDGAALAAPGAGQGTPAAGRMPDPRLFIAPELASGDAIGPAGDMFSLGAVVAFAAGGKGPFGIGGQPGSPYYAPYGVPDLGGVPASLRPLITRCLDADPGWRPTAGEFRSLATSLLPDAAGSAQWPEVDRPDRMAGRAGGSASGYLLGLASFLVLFIAAFVGIQNAPPRSALSYTMGWTICLSLLGAILSLVCFRKARTRIRRERAAIGAGGVVMTEATPEQQALHALARDLPRGDLPMAAQLEYDRLRPAWERGQIGG